MMEEVEIKEEAILEKYRRLSPAVRREVVGFMDFLAKRNLAGGWVEFDQWAMDLAKKRGFERLSEQDVARIVEDFRAARQCEWSRRTSLYNTLAWCKELPSAGPLTGPELRCTLCLPCG
jgi:hypothetical protein